ncbi:MAG: amidophosphoribosyltransferase, partial [Myxococcales bacterium]
MDPAEHSDDAACFAPVAREPTGLYPSTPFERSGPLKLNVLPRSADPLDDKFHDECGVFGIFGHAEASNLTYLGIHALQHRGQESAGIASLENGEISLHKGMGLVADVFDAGTLQKLGGHAAIGHTRYSTAGQSRIENAQPFFFKSAVGPIAVAHNGNLVNAEEIRSDLEAQGAIFQGSSDTELLLHLIAREKGSTPLERIQAALSRVRGAYSLLFLTEDSIVAVRDPLGFRPLLVGNLRGKTVFASESCALDLVEAEVVREVEPGEMVVVDEKSIRTVQRIPPQRRAQCIFELVYFARPDSQVFG